MHKMKSEARLMNSAKLKRMGIEGKTENGLYGSEELPSMLPQSEPAGGKPNRKRFATGGVVSDMEGETARKRLDRPKRGKGGTNVNIVIAPQGGAPDAAAQPPMPPPGMVAPPSPPPPAPPGGPQIPPAALAAMMGGAGGPKPPGLKTGGRTPYKSGGVVKMNAGAGSGEGRIEKDKAYGKRAREGEC